MSTLFGVPAGEVSEADAQLAYAAPADLPALVLAVSYGEAIAGGVSIESVTVTWQHVGRPGVFTTELPKTDGWQTVMDETLRREVFTVESIYALLGGWPAPTPPPTSTVDTSGTIYGVYPGGFVS